MTIDGFCDHTSGIPDEALHLHYANLLNNAGAALYGRITYQLMEFWRTVLENPSGDKGMDDFAVAIDNTPKIVFSRTLKTWIGKLRGLQHRTLKKKSLISDNSRARIFLYAARA